MSNRHENTFQSAQSKSGQNRSDRLSSRCQSNHLLSGTDSACSAFFKKNAINLVHGIISLQHCLIYEPRGIRSAQLGPNGKPTDNKIGSTNSSSRNCCCPERPPFTAMGRASRPTRSKQLNLEYLNRAQLTTVAVQGSEQCYEYTNNSTQQYRHCQYQCFLRFNWLIWHLNWTI